jgi:hypothetical protein
VVAEDAGVGKHATSNAVRVHLPFEARLIDSTRPGRGGSGGLSRAAFVARFNPGHHSTVVSRVKGTAVTGTALVRR